MEVYKPGTRGNYREASSVARDEIGVRFLVTPGLEGVLKRHWEIVAMSRPLFSPIPFVPEGLPRTGLGEPRPPGTRARDFGSVVRNTCPVELSWFLQPKSLKGAGYF